MNRLSAAKAAFQNPERMTISFPVVNMSPDMPRPLTEDQTEAEKQTAQMIYQRFVEALEEMPEKNDRAMDYGMKLISAQFPDKESLLRYSMLWPLFYVGYKEGLKDAAQQ